MGGLGRGKGGGKEILERILSLEGVGKVEGGGRGGAMVSERGGEGRGEEVGQNRPL